MPLAALGVGAFVAQEHLERLIHTGHVPFLFASPTLWLGIALQLPLAVAIWFVARRLAEDIATPVRRTVRRVPRLVQLLAPLVLPRVASAPGAAFPARGPPITS